ncbi:tetratricopeptide repeat protein [Flavobacterium terrisoli]|uniref:tetratricopeptide repeat protein n=1 Tax=Flavobacterium terrisoli TaxID=3242195 RepID=UPI00254321EE|nr:tetratricopeptide repeat protein [Flavobacterium buctense]
MIKKILFTTLTLLSLFVKAQNQDGYWDKDRTTNRETVLASGSKTWIRTDEFPIGTTEIVYRITILDVDQKMVNSLSAALMAIPDPSGISKGSGLALSLMSGLSGDDYCYYSIFNSYELANNYSKTGNYKTACYSNPNEINKDVNRIVLNKSICLTENTRYLWFGFKNTNMVMNEKIILEVVPWVDNKASRGWTNEIKTQFIERCKTNQVMSSISNPEEYCLCLLSELQNGYKVQDFQKLIPQEQNKIIEDVGKKCLSSTGELDNIYDKERNQASVLISNKQYVAAINKYLEIIKNSTPKYTDYNNLGYCYILTKQYLKAIKYLKEGEKIDETDLMIKGNLAHAYLLNGDFEIAKGMYLKYKSQNINETMSWVDMVKADFNDFKTNGVFSEHYNEILSLIN